MKARIIFAMLILFSGIRMTAQITAPEPLAGHEVTQDYITRTLVYPQADLEQGNSGKVIVDMHIDPQGVASNYTIKSSFSEEASPIALHLVKTILWKPALNIGIPMDYDYEYEVNFNARSYKRHWKRHERPTVPLTLEADTSYKIYEYKQLEEAARPYFADGGNMGKYIATNMEFPAEAKEREIQGTVRLSFIVETDGNVSNIVSSTRWAAAATTKPSDSSKGPCGFLPRRTGNTCAAPICKTLRSALERIISKTGTVIS